MRHIFQFLCGRFCLMWTTNIFFQLAFIYRLKIAETPYLMRELTSLVFSGEYALIVKGSILWSALVQVLVLPIASVSARCFVIWAWLLNRYTRKEWIKNANSCIKRNHQCQMYPYDDDMRGFAITAYLSTFSCSSQIGTKKYFQPSYKLCKSCSKYLSVDRRLQLTPVNQLLEWGEGGGCLFKETGLTAYVKESFNNN